MSLKNITIHQTLKDFCGIDVQASVSRVNVKCPFHNGVHSNSLAIYTETNSAYCFGGCGFLDPTAVVSKQLGISRGEAYKALQQRYGITLLSPEELAELNRFEKLEVYIAACSQHLTLEHHEALKARGVTEETVKKLKIGFHPQDFSDLSEVELLDLGIYNRNDCGEIISDFSGKIVLPCYLNGKLVYTIAWNYQKNEGDASYANPLGWSRPVIGTSGQQPLVVEGYFDFIIFEQLRIPCLCTLTSTPSSAQTAFLKKFNSLDILFDADQSGSANAQKLGVTLYPRAKIVVLPQAQSAPVKDPNDLWLAIDAEQQFRTVITLARKDAIDLLDQSITNIKTVHRSTETPEILSRELIPLIAKLPLEQQKAYVDVLAKELKFCGISKTAIGRALKSRSNQEKSEETNNSQPSHATALFNGVKDELQLFADEYHHGYAAVEINGHRKVFNLLSDDFKRFLRHRYHTLFNRIPPEEIIRSVLNQLDSLLLYQTHPITLQLRVAEKDNAFFYDMGDDASTAIKIVPGSWQRIYHPPLLFRRYGVELPQVEPDPNGTLTPLFDLLRITDAQQRLLVMVYLVYCLIPKVPKVILYVTGEKGSTKTVTSLTLASLIDPWDPGLLKAPREEDRAVTQLSHHYVALFDNVNHIPLWFAELCCTATTGIGEERRRKYTDDGLFIIKYRRCVIINAINRLGTTYTDFLDRILLIKLQRVERRDRLEQEEFERRLDAIKPQVVGGMFNALAKAMQIKPTLVVEEKERMADFTVWGCAIAIALGYSKEDFLGAYAANRRMVNLDVVGSHIVAFAISEFIERQKTVLEGAMLLKRWEGTMTELLDELALVADDLKLDPDRNKSWPKTPSKLSMRLSEINSNLLDIGISVERSSTGGGTQNKRKVQITKLKGNDECYEVTTSEVSAARESRDAQDAKPAGQRDEGDFETANTALSCEHGDVVAVDIETTGLNPYRGDICLISASGYSKGRVYRDPEHLRAMLANSSIKKVFHNATFDVWWLKAKGYEVVNYDDTMIMSQVLDGNKGKHDLATLVHEKLGFELDKSLQHAKNWQGFITEEHEEYALRDAEVTYRLYNQLLKDLETHRLLDVYKREIAALPALIRLQLDGIPFEGASWQQDLEEHVQQRNQLESSIKEELGVDTAFNLSSPQQLLECLRVWGLPIDDTSDSTLARYETDFPIIAKIRQYREVTKLTTSYGENLLEVLNGGRRFHPTFRAIGTISGRMSCKEPNVQQVPHILKQYFRAPAGKTFVMADFSQIELRIAAAISKDAAMCLAFQEGEDLHYKTAQLLLRKNGITAEERQIAKAVNFGLIYGMTAEGLQQSIKTNYGIDLSLKEAKAFRTAFFRHYSGIQRWHSQQIVRSSVQTLGGRTWKGLPKPGDQYKKGQGTWRQRLNLPIQGSGAEGLKEALALLEERLSNQNSRSTESSTSDGSDWKLVNVVHDEVILEVPEADAEKAAALLQECMVSGMERLVDAVPIAVEVTMNTSWDTQGGASNVVTTALS